MRIGLNGLKNDGLVKIIPIMQKIFKINLANSKKWFTFAVPFREEGTRSLKILEEQVQASTEKLRIESVDFFGN